jgi:hypothetical protein
MLLPGQFGFFAVRSEVMEMEQERPSVTSNYKLRPLTPDS